MSRPAVSSVALLGLSVLVGSTVLSAQSATRLGGELQVNSYTIQKQVLPAVAVDGDGDFIVVWTSYDQDGSSYGIFGRRFNAAGTGQAAEFRVNAYTSFGQTQPSIAADLAGNFVVTWDSSGQDGSGRGIFARRFNAAGAAQGSELQINSYTTSVQRTPAVALESDGDFVVAWASIDQDGENYGVFARRFNSAGAGVGSELQVNLFTSSRQDRPAIAIDAQGDFVIAWESYGSHDGAGYGVFARRFSSAGTPQASEFQVNAYTTGAQYDVGMAVAPNGDFVIAWASVHPDGASYDIVARRFDSAGVARGSELEINTHTGSKQAHPRVSLESDGDFVVTWHSNDQDGSNYGTFARRFASDGAPRGDELQVNTYTPGFQRDPVVGATGSGFVVAWSSQDQDGEDFGVFAQRFASLAVLDIDGNGAVTALTDGLLVLRFLFGFTGTTLTTGVVGGGCTRCDPTSIGDYLETLI